MLIIQSKINVPQTFTDHFLQWIIEQAINSVNDQYLLQAFVEMVGAIVNVESRVYLDKLMTSQYPLLMVGVLKRPGYALRFNPPMMPVLLFTSHARIPSRELPAP